MENSLPAVFGMLPDTPSAVLMWMRIHFYDCDMIQELIEELETRARDLENGA
jgi:hypothetical protein